MKTTLILNAVFIVIAAILLPIIMRKPYCTHHEEFIYLLEYSNELIRNSHVSIDTSSVLLDGYRMLQDSTTGDRSYMFVMNEKAPRFSGTTEYYFIAETDKDNRLLSLGWYK